MIRDQQLRRRVLETLENCAGYALPESTLRSHVDALERPAPDDGEWAAVLVFLEKQDAIGLVPHALDPDLKQYTLTERGRVLLAQ